MQMSFSEYNGSKTKVTQAVGRMFKNAQESFTKIQPTHVGNLLKTMSPSTNNTECEHDRKKKTLSMKRFGFQKLQLRKGLEKRRNKRHAELLDNQETGDHDDSGDEIDLNPRQYPSSPHTDLAMSPSSHSLPVTKTPKRWPF